MYHYVVEAARSNVKEAADVAPSEGLSRWHVLGAHATERLKGSLTAYLDGDQIIHEWTALLPPPANLTSCCGDRKETSTCELWRDTSTQCMALELM